jgi:hypothetical protein
LGFEHGQYLVGAEAVSALQVVVPRRAVPPLDAFGHLRPLAWSAVAAESRLSAPVPDEVLDGQHLLTGRAVSLAVSDMDRTVGRFAHGAPLAHGTSL